MKFDLETVETKEASGRGLKRARENSASSSTEARRKALARRNRRRARAMVDFVMADEGLTHLEEKSVAETTAKQHKDELEKFVRFARPRLGERQPYGRAPPGLPEPPLPGRSLKLQGGQADRRVLAPLPEVWSP